MYTFLQLNNFEQIVLSYHCVYRRSCHFTWQIWLFDKVPPNHEMSRVSPTKPPQVLVAKDILLAGSIRHLEAMIQVGTLYEKKTWCYIYICRYAEFIHLPAVCCFLRRYTCTWIDCPSNKNMIGYLKQDPPDLITPKIHKNTTLGIP